MTTVTAPKQTYIKKDQIEHILTRCDMYTGSNRLRKYDDLVAIKDDEGNFQIVKKEITSSPAILRIFIEGLSNAIDNHTRSKDTNTPCTTIKVNIDKETGETRIWNDGMIVPIEIHEKEKIYNHTLIFSNLLTGSNYDDSIERDVSGLFGLGIKLCNIFSKKFTVKGLDPDNKKTFEQTYTNNMRTSTEPIVKPTKLSKGYTEITYFPEFKHFDLEGYTDDIISLYTRYIIDAAMLTKTKVYFNDELIPVNSLQTYGVLYDSPTDDNLFVKTKSSEVLITPSSEFEAISFVNGVFTRLGGIHVDMWCEEIFRPLVNKINKKDKPQLNIKDIKNFFRIFIVCTLPNPRFSSQDKEKLESPKLVDVEITSKDINKIMKWSIIEEIQDIITAKEMLTLKKTERKKKGGYTKVEGLDPANFAGGKRSAECSLILSEGDSAKTYAAEGIQKGIDGVEGRDFYGLMSLGGKCEAPDTPILLYNGEIKEAQYIEIGDVLVNDLGEPTTVLQLFSGEDNMYEIKQTRGMSYTVNSEHMLTLKIRNHCSIYWLEETKQWKITYYDREINKIKHKVITCVKNTDDKPIPHEKIYLCEVKSCENYEYCYSNRSNLTKHYKMFHTDVEIPKKQKFTAKNRSFLSKEDGEKEILKFAENIDRSDIIDIDIETYLKLNKETKASLRGFKLSNPIEWDKKDVKIDPYILGMWLGDGSSDGRSFAGEDVELINEWLKWCRENNCEIIHNQKDAFNIRKAGIDSHRIEIGSKHSSNKECNGCKYKLSTACSNNKELLDLGHKRIIEIQKRQQRKNSKQEHPLIKLLSNYNLIQNKHIPNDYIINDKETRLQLLAGFIDTDGSIDDHGRIEICQSKEHKNLLDSLLFICRSLGFFCSLSPKKTSYTYKDEKIYKDCYRLMISGNGISEIPTLLVRKQLTHKFTLDSLKTEISVIEKGFGKYVGFLTDKTHRFLLGDFTVTHNCLNVRNAKLSVIAKNKVITNLTQALGLQYDLDYTDDKNFKTLNYGRVILLADADVDQLSQ